MPRPTSSRMWHSPSSPISSPMDFVEEINPNEIKTGEAIGRGSYGTVKKGRWKRRDVAVKIFHTTEERESFEVEVQQLSCVKHPNIVTLYGAWTKNIPAYLVMEYAEGGSLNHLLHETTQPYDLNNALSWALQTARGVAYLHNMKPKPIMHRDLKPANLLLFSNGKILKLCDFGTACAVRTQMTNNTGSASYMAPEVFKTSNYHEKCDVFSWAIILWEVLARRRPFNDANSSPYKIMWAINEGERPQSLKDCPEEIENLMQRAWAKEPLTRPSMQEVVKEIEYIYKLSGNGPLALLPTQSKISSGYDGSYVSDSIDHLIVEAYKALPPQLRPIPPSCSDPESIELFRKHSSVAVKYLRRNIGLEMIQRRTEELEEMGQNESLQEFERLKQQADETQELKLFKTNMIKQLRDFIDRSRETRELNGWTMIEN